jgi:predicted AlkP superfamily phosphohydrolase/phosphomutase
MSALVNRLLVVGLDGATFDALDPLIARGVLPNLEHLRRRAAWGALRSTTPYITPVAWTTFLTGCGPECHHILDFHYLDHSAGAVRANHSGRIRRPTLYQVLSDAGRPVVSLNLPMTTPPPDVRGLVVGGFDSPTARAAFGPHEEFQRLLETQVPSYTVRPVWRGYPKDLAALEHTLRETEAVFLSRSAAARLADGRIDWSLMVVQFQDLDCLQHRVWNCLGVGPVPSAPADWRRAVEACLRTLDRAVGELLELADRRRAAVAVVSDHGFGAFEAKISVSELLLRARLLNRRTWPQAARQWYGRSLRRARKWVYRRRHAGASTGLLARPLESFSEIDWARSLAVALHGNLAALLYLNSRERFAAGPLRDERQKRAALARVLETFEAARHPETGARLFDDVFSVAERYGCDPLHENLPEAIAVPVAGYHSRTKFNAGGAMLAGDPTLTGTHRLEGVLLLDAPGVRPGPRQTADLRDVAPTLLALFGHAPPKQMTGRVLRDWFQQSVFTPQAPSPSPVQDPAHSPAGPHVYSKEDETTITDRLRQLGYME